MHHNDKKAVGLYLLKFTLSFSCLLPVQFAGTYNTMWFFNILHNLLICCITIYATYYVGANMSLSRHPHRPMCYLLCYVGGQHAPKETPPQPTFLQEVGADVCAVLHHLSPGVQGVRRAEGVVQWLRPPLVCSPVNVTILISSVSLYIFLP